MWKKSFFNVNIIKIWFPNGFLHRHIFTLNIKIRSSTLLFTPEVAKNSPSPQNKIKAVCFYQVTWDPRLTLYLYGQSYLGDQFFGWPILMEAMVLSVSSSLGMTSGWCHLVDQLLLKLLPFGIGKIHQVMQFHLSKIHQHNHCHSLF